MSESNGYIGRSPGDSSIVLAQEYFQPTGAGKTFLFTAGYDPGYVDVYRNGVKLINVLDYAATDGKNIVLDTPVGVGSTVQVVAYKAFNLGTIESSTNDFTVGSNLFVQSGFGSFGKGITANEIDVSGIGTIGIGSFVDIHVSGGATVAGTLVANAFSGDGSLLTNVSGIVTANIVSVAITTKDINVSAAATITGALTGSTGTFSGAINIDATTASTSTSTGALIVDGGVGIVKDVFVGDAIDVAKDLKVGAAATITGALTGSTGTFSGAVSGTTGTFSGAVSGTTGTFSGAVNIDATTDSTSTSTGALIVDGGAAIAKNVYIGAGLSVAGTLTYEDVTSVDSVGLITAKSGVNITGGQLTVGSGITMGIAGVATFSGTSDVHLLDGVKAIFGDSSDLHITHNGSNSFIEDSGTGALYVDSNHIIFRKYNTAEVLAQFVSDGSVELYEDNTKRLETTTTGVSIAGTTISNGGDFISYDNGHLKLGTNSDLDLFHSGTDSFIRSAINNLNINAGNSAGNVYINLNENVAGVTSERSASFNKNGSVDLYYDANKRFETTNDGVNITGVGTFTQGANFAGMLKETCNVAATKLSASTDIDLSNGMVHYYTTNETTTATPNIRWSSSYSLNNKMNTGDTITVSIIYKPNGAGYYASLNVDGSGVTEEWNGGAAPSAANSGGYDVLTHTLVKTADATFLCLSNVQNYA